MNSVINIKVEPKIKRQAQNVASSLGLSLSGVINAYLRQFVRLQTLYVSNKFDEPSELLNLAIREAREDRIKKRINSFVRPADAVKFVDDIIAEKKR